MTTTQHVHVSVSDTGVGLPHDFEAKRVNSLGLILVTSLATQLGGKLEIVAGSGAEFVMTLKVDEPKQQVDNTV